MTATMRSRLSVLLWVACAIVFSVQTAHVVRASGTPIAGNDFPAFYCAGAALAAHAGPYTLEPLRTCEHAIAHGSDLPAQYVTPAPLPPYALDLFAAIAALPYREAAWLWFAVVTAACVLLAVTVGRVSSVPSGAVAVALLLPAALGSASIGQIPPLATCAIALSGLALLAAEDGLAAILACAATMEPHIGIPAALSLFFFRPRTRWWLVSCGAAAACVCIATVGAHGTAYYFVSVLPAQARAELMSSDQFSLSHVLTIAHVPATIALLGGSLSYLAALAAGIIAAPHCARRLGDAALTYVPCAAVLVGGTFVHQIQLIAALPAAFLFMARASDPQRWAGRCAAAAIAAAPFTLLSEHRLQVYGLGFICACAALWVAVEPDGKQLKNFVGSLALAGCCVALPAEAAHEAHALPLPRVATIAMPGGSDASDNWSAYLRSDPRYAAFRAGAELAKLPAWLGLAALLAASLGMGAMGVVWPRAIGYARTLQPVIIEDRVGL